MPKTPANKTSNSLPLDMVEHIFKFLSVKDVASVSSVSKDFSTTLRTQVVLSNIIPNTIKSDIKIDVPASESKAAEQGKKIDWIKYYSTIQEHKKRVTQQAEMKKIKEQFVEVEENRRAYVNRTGGSIPPYGILNKETCLAGCGCGVCCGTVCYLTAMLISSGATEIAAAVGSLCGLLTGYLGGNVYLEHRANTFNYQTLEAPLVDEAFTNPDELEMQKPRKKP